METKNIPPRLAFEMVESVYKDHSRMRIENIVFLYGTLDPESDWVKIAAGSLGYGKTVGHV